MRREFKFRTWGSAGTHPRSMQMHYYKLGSKLSAIWGGGEHVMQYTGLQDKYGKDIYEGDIIKAESTGWSRDYVASVEFLGGKFISTFMDSEIPHYVEVIGNVYENADLLSNRE